MLSLNIAHGRRRPGQLLMGRRQARANLEHIARVLRREEPAVAALQEVDFASPWTGRFDHCQFLAAQAGLVTAPGHHTALGQLRYGTALLAANALRETTSLRFAQGRPLPPKGFVVARTSPVADRPAREVDVVSIHLDPLRARIRLEQISELVGLLERDRSRPLVVMGDFNCGWRPGSAVRAVARALDLETHEPETGPATFPASGRRLDWILASRELRFVRHDVLQDRVSDHLAVRATLRLQEG